jgi:hypothetical protein
VASIPLGFTASASAALAATAASLPPAVSLRHVASSSSVVAGITTASGLTLAVIDAVAGLATRTTKAGRAQGAKPGVRRIRR